MAIPTERELVPRGPWPEGANNVAREDSIPSGQFRSGINVDVYPGGKLRRRRGQALSTAQAGSRCAWSDGHYALFRAAGSLYRFVPGQTPLLLCSGLQIDADMAYCSVNQYIYVSDGAQALRVDTQSNAVRAWGLPTPLGQPTLTATANGGLDAGTYQVAITYLDASKEESGSTLSTQVDVVQGGGIALSAFPPAPADVAAVNIYLTQANQVEMCLYATVPYNVSSVQLFRDNFGRPLQTQFLSPLPAGNDAAFTLGRLFVAIGNSVCWSEAQRYGLFSAEFNYVSYAAPVVLLAATAPGAQSQGLFVATTARTYFLQGTAPGQFNSILAYTAGAVPGTMTMISGSYFEADGVPNVPVPVWVSTVGTVCIGMPDGTVRPLTEGRFAMAVGERGSAIFRELDGVRQALFTMRPPTATSPLAATDSLTITRVKNGLSL